MTYERQFLAGFDAAGISPKFLPAAYGMFGQESSFGRASPNVLQVTASTAAKPGYGLAPLSGQDINDPAKSSAFALQLLKAKAEHAGLSFENPADYPAILRLHNGGGDPNYVQHVAARTPLTIPEEVPTGPKEEPEMASQPAPQLTYVPPPIPKALQDAADPSSRRNLSQILLRAGAGFAGGRTFGEGISGALAGAADATDQQERSAAELYKQQQLAGLYGLRADTATANIGARLGAAQTSADARVKSAQTRADVLTRGQDLNHQDKQASLSQRADYQANAIKLRQALANARGLQTAALTGAPYTPVGVDGVPPAGSVVQGPQGGPAIQGPPGAEPQPPQTPPGQPPQELPPAPPSDPWALQALPVPGGIRGAQQFSQKNQSERDRYARDHATALTDDQALLNNLEHYQGAYDRLQNTVMSKPGMGASWRIPLASVLSGNGLGNPDAAALKKEHSVLTSLLARANGSRVLVAGLKVAGQSLPDESVPYQAGSAVLKQTTANARLQMAVDKARATLLQHNPNATPAQIESALGEYVQGIGNPLETGDDGSVTSHDIPSFEQWKSKGSAVPKGDEGSSKDAPKAPSISAPPAAVDYLRNNPQFSEAFDQKYGKGAAAAILGK